jgi:hypothetical protein
MKKTKKPESHLYFELLGEVNIVEKKGNKIISKEPIDGKVVLQLLVHVLEEQLDYMLKKKVNI